MIDLALLSLRPGAEWTLNGETYDGLIWLDTVQQKPTLEEINQEIERLTIEYEKKQYQRDRADNYPAIKEQLDMIWHAIDSGTLDHSSNFYLTIKSIKDRYPKN